MLFRSYRDIWLKSLNDIGIQGKIYTENVSSAGISFNYNQAIRTFREISIEYGGESPYLKIWAANQNRVFSACSSSSNQYNPPIRPNYKLLPKRAQSDFLYQLGSWHFYIGDYKEVLKYYEDLEKMADALALQRARTARRSVPIAQPGASQTRPPHVKESHHGRRRPRPQGRRPHS